VTQDPQMLALIDEAGRFKDSDVPILLLGETGTGKDLLAKAIHCDSKRKDKRFVKVNCAAIPENLLESELFGYKRGAFSGADKDKKGFFEEADGGTILLNEIGDLPLRLQAKILDVVEDKEITRLGEVKPRKVDFRVIAATSKDLSEEVGKGDFREDLYHRLNVVSLRLPPLRERKSDIPLLIRHFLANSSIKIDWEDLDFQPYLDYHWPGNVRELENEFRRHSSASELVKALGEWDKTSNEAACGKLTEMERRQIVEAVGTTGSKREAAGLLGISLATLYRKMKLHNLAL
ncbi:MAG: sigma 54-interacting transcriptional regulator, partial [Candidatus Zixiibacteriota bacterium]